MVIVPDQSDAGNLAWRLESPTIGAHVFPQPRRVPLVGNISEKRASPRKSCTRAAREKKRDFNVGRPNPEREAEERVERDKKGIDKKGKKTSRDLGPKRTAEDVFRAKKKQKNLEANKVFSKKKQ